MRRHHDANQIYRLLVAREIAAAIRADPSLLDHARRTLTAMAARPHTGDAVACWERLLAEPVDIVAELLARDDHEGDYVRETMPAFMALDAPTRTRLVARSRAMHAAEQEAS